MRCQLLSGVVGLVVRWAISSGGRLSRQLTRFWPAGEVAAAEVSSTDSRQ